MKTIMILGAGLYQLPLIKTAQNMGLRVVTVTPKGNYPGIQAADKWYDVDTRNYEAILDIAKQENICGVCTTGTDVAIKSLGYVVDELNLAGVSFDAACKATDKSLMKAAFEKGGVSTATFRTVYSLEQARAAAQEIGYPIMVKITDSSGSRGINKAANQSELETAYAECVAATRNDYVIVERFICGNEIGVDGFVDKDGALSIILPHDKFVRATPTAAVPGGHRFPLECTKDTLRAINEQITLAVHALGLTGCSFNADVFVSNDGVHIIEMGARTGGVCIPELISIYKGYDWYELLIRAALGEDVSFDSPEQNPCMAKLLFSDKTCQVENIDEDALERLRGQGMQVSLDVTVGDTIEKLVNGTNRFGQIIMKGTDEAAIDAAIENVMDCLELA